MTKFYMWIMDYLFVEKDCCQKLGEGVNRT